MMRWPERGHSVFLKPQKGLVTAPVKGFNTKPSNTSGSFQGEEAHSVGKLELLQKNSSIKLSGDSRLRSKSILTAL